MKERNGNLPVHRSESIYEVITRNIQCCDCGQKGEIEIMGLDQEGNPDIFRYLGNHEFSGDMYFRCPGCGCELIVNPMDALGPGILKGLPRDAMQRQTWNFLQTYFQAEGNLSEKP